MNQLLNDLQGSLFYLMFSYWVAIVLRVDEMVL